MNGTRCNFTWNRYGTVHTILKLWSKWFCPLTKLTEIICQRTCVQNFVWIDLNAHRLKTLYVLFRFSATIRIIYRIDHPLFPCHPISRLIRSLLCTYRYIFFSLICPLLLETKWTKGWRIIVGLSHEVILLSGLAYLVVI